jgi:hypothetical protein
MVDRKLDTKLLEGIHAALTAILYPALMNNLLDKEQRSEVFETIIFLLLQVKGVQDSVDKGDRVSKDHR